MFKQNHILPEPNRREHTAIFYAILWIITCACVSKAHADLNACQKKLDTGDYEGCIVDTGRAITDGEFSERWRLLKTTAHMRIGQYKQAKETVETALKRFHSSIQLRLLAHDVYQQNGQTDLAKQMLLQINQLVSDRAWWYTDAPDMIVQGRAALLLGADAKQVLQVIYDVVQQKYPTHVGTYKAIGELALSKHDYAEAANAYAAGVKHFPDNADMHFGLAMAYLPSDGGKAETSIATCLKLNPNHIGAKLATANQLIDGEYFDEAEKQLAEVLAINPAHPKAWAYTAALAHLNNEPIGESLARNNALKHWPTNPMVDHVIGQKLSRKYRFAESAAYQRKALAMKSDYQPALMQLSQDLLRLGNVKEGWSLAQQVLDKDAFNVVAYNLVALQKEIAKYTVLEDEHFILRMEKKEAAIYGQRVKHLLHEAYNTLGDKYDLKPKGKITVEIFPEQKDFAIRTFGLPGGAGYLGVCFGNVITANSPASQGSSPTNWQSVLWHEYCHVVTLHATRNRMPRWLSEGISVYEERQRDDSWGQRMNPTFRQMVMQGGLTPVGKLSAAFLRAPTPMHIQFAYYQSSLVVEYIIKTKGLDAIKAVLKDLHQGVYINAALAKHVEPIKALEKHFETYAKKRAAALAPGADWSQIPKAVASDEDALRQLIKEQPNHLPAKIALANHLIATKQWDQAKELLRRIAEVFPNDNSSTSCYLMLSKVHRELNETAQEYAVLKQFAALDANAQSVFERLLEIAAQGEDWPAVRRHAEQLLAVNPLVPMPYHQLARAAEYTNDHSTAITAYQTLLEMRPADPAQVHYQLAKLMRDARYPVGYAIAKRHVLQAIEEAPRFRKAHRLLLNMLADEKQQPTAGK